MEAPMAAQSSCDGEGEAELAILEEFCGVGKNSPGRNARFGLRVLDKVGAGADDWSKGDGEQESEPTHDGNGRHRVLHHTNPNAGVH